MVAWLALPLAVGPSLADALAGRSGPVQATAEVVAWGVWAATLVAVLVPRTTSLTGLRIAAPLVAVAAVVAAPQGGVGAADVVSVAWAAGTLVLAMAPATGDVFVNGSSYGDERRMPLRPPAALLAGPVELAWLAVVVPVVAAPLLLAAGATVAGLAVALVGVPAAVVGVRALHGLARRWVVFVPAGLVVHDLLALADPVLLTRPSIRRLGPARADEPGLDLTRGALGLALAVELGPEPVELPRRDGRTTTMVRTDRLLVAPTRPGALLREAAGRHLAVG
ncbi:MAG: hypothetical protein AB7L84_11865 [Acidimicrobiia bacterium]